ncbi:MAG: formylglycine-generating enzyme family protein [Thiothrix sp.]|uniref:formylglycine-generating enzyme family protein n=1 Tax=Thiothrix sp. TaxID=1032 RepID=UPI00262DDF6B|nr:formylglycine-generating enzyme family protein [Thiothrix sp.]MDD5395259.1 formylglycine-generating enzyme family protein [Thiothrix sp.]
MSKPRHRRSQLNRADLLGLSVLGEQSALQYLAGQLGLEQQPLVDSYLGITGVTCAESESVAPLFTPAAVICEGLKPEVGFWLLERREATVLEAADSDNTDFSAPVGWTSRPQTKPAYYPLVSPRSLLPRLFHHLKHQRVGRELDVDAVMKKLGRGEYLYHIPRASRRSLGRHLHIIDDHHLHLTPYWLDQGLFANLLESYLPDYANSRDLLVDGQMSDWVLPPEGSVVLVFSDLGALSENPAEQVAMWLRIGAMLQRMDCKLIAVVPCHPEACDSRLRALFNLEPWEPLRQLDKRDKGTRREQAGELLHLLAPAIRLEPGLLRSVRLAVAQHGYNFDASVEAAVWQHPDMLELSSVAATPNPAARSQWLERFGALPDPLKQTVLDIIRQWRSPLREQVWFEEISSLDASSRQVVPQADLVDANQYFRQLSQRYDGDNAEVLADVATRSWFRRMEKRLPLAAWDLPEVGTTLQQIAVQVHKHEQVYHADYPIDPAKLPSSHSKEQTLALVQQGEVLFVVATSAINQLLGKVKGNGLVGEGIIGGRAVVGGVALGGAIGGAIGGVLGGMLGGVLGSAASKTISSTLGDNVLGDVLGNAASKTVSSVVGGVGGAVLGEVLGNVASKIISSDALISGSYLGSIKLRRGLLYVEAVDATSGTVIRHSLQFQAGQMTEPLCVLTKAAARVVRGDMETLYFRQVQRPTWADSIGRDAEGLFIEHHCLGNHYRSYWQPPTIDGAGHWQGFPPGDIGTDNYGLYADLDIKGITQRFRWIEPGTFLMGSPESEAERYGDEVQHQVTLTQGFWLADTTVTQAQWQAVMGNNPSRFSDNPNNPVEQVSWNDIQDFLQKLNALIPSLQAKLPTEAQWEYACRAGTTTPFSFGDNITPEQVNYEGNYPYAGGKKGLYREKTVPVKSLPANPWGLFEMHGNVWEWCQDVWQEKLPASPVTDPEGVAGGDKAGVERVVRGGSWGDFGGSCRSAYRFRYEPDGRSDSGGGFRLILGHFELRPGRAAEPQNRQERTAQTRTDVARATRQAVAAPGAGKSRKKPKKRK